MEALATLWEASWREAMPAIDFSARKAWLCAHLPALEAAGAVTICGFDEDGRLLGFATVDPQNGYLDQIAVAPEAKSSGAAGALLAEARRIRPNLSISTSTRIIRARCDFTRAKGLRPSRRASTRVRG